MDIYEKLFTQWLMMLCLFSWLFIGAVWAWMSLDFEFDED